MTSLRRCLYSAIIIFSHHNHDNNNSKISWKICHLFQENCLTWAILLYNWKVHQIIPTLFSDLLNVDCTMYGTMTKSVNEPINIHQFITLASSGLRQHVDFPTHIHGHWIDLFITRTACDLIKTVYPSDGLSDHMAVIADVGVKLVSHPIKKCFSYRRVKSIPLADFISEKKFSALISHPKLTCSELYQQYHTALRSLFDKYAPIKTKKITPKPPNP